MKYRKRPITIEAERFDGSAATAKRLGLRPTGIHEWVIDTLEGPLNVRPGDWVATGFCGEKYPIKNAIFQQTYEPVEA